MKRIFVALLICGLAVVCAACSVAEDFYVVNGTESTLTVEYKWNGNLYSSPRKFKFESFDGKRLEKLEPLEGFAKEELDAAEEKNEIRIILEPKEVLRVHSVINESRERIEKTLDKSFHVTELNLKGPKGSVQLGGEQAYFQFRPLQQGYFIIYR